MIICLMCMRVMTVQDQTKDLAYRIVRRDQFGEIDLIATGSRVTCPECGIQNISIEGFGMSKFSKGFRAAVAAVQEDGVEILEVT